MSTAAPRSPRIEEAHGRIRHPLDRLRKYINAYVLLEALGLVALALALAFWAGFWADYGVFKAFNFDWVQSESSPMLVFLAILSFLGMLAGGVWVVIAGFQRHFLVGLIALGLCFLAAVAVFPCVGLLVLAVLDWKRMRGAFALLLASGFVFSLAMVGVVSESSLGFGSWGFRLLVLASFVVGMLALVVWVVSTRFFKEFRDSALAMVLENRFPKQLGGRVITAVELHDPKSAAAYGYSPALVARTIHEAAEHIETVPVAQVFAWNRLYTYALVLLFLTLGNYVLTAAGFVANRAAENQAVKQRAKDAGVAASEVLHPPLTGVSDFHDVAATWFERNILLRNVIWPRSAHVELLPLDPREKTQANYEPRIARDQPPPTLRAVAWKYVKTDRTRPEGLRQVTWADLSSDPSLAGVSKVPAVEARWAARDADAGITVDEVELRLDAFVVRKDKLPGGEKLPATYCTPDAAGSWRPLTWADLSQEKLAGLPVRPLPAEWDPTARAAGMFGMTGVGLFEGLARGAIATKLESLEIADVQKVAAQAEKEADEALAEPAKLSPDAHDKARAGKQLATDVRKAIDFLDHLAELREVLDGVDARATQRGLRRSMRKLTVPTEAALHYAGKRSAGRVTMTRMADNEFTGTFSELKESVTYYVRAADYVTPTKRLNVVELPRLEKLESEEERPAYLYYRPIDPFGPSEMRGVRQKFQPVGVSLSGEASTVEVPMDTVLTLTGTSSKPLTGVVVVEFERLKELLAKLRPALAGLTAAEARQEKRKPEAWPAAAARLEKAFGAELAKGKTADGPALVKAVSSAAGTDDLDALAAALAAGGEQGKLLTELFEKAKTADKDLVDSVADLNALARLVKDVRDLVRNRVLDHLGTPKLTGDKTFELAVTNVRREQKFTLEFEDKDDVKGRRAVVVQPREDVAPRVREFNPDDVIRKGKEGYVVTANARVPFKGRVRDDLGLARVRFACKVTPADFISDQKYLALNGVGGILPACRPETRLLSLMYLGLVNRTVANATTEEAGDEQIIEIPAFQLAVEANKQNDGRNELLDVKTRRDLLAERQREPFRRLMADFVLAPDKWTDNDHPADTKQADDEARWAKETTRGWLKADDPRAVLGFDLPLWELKYNGEPLKEKDLGKPQKRYLVEVRLLADDTYTEGAEFVPSVVFDSRRKEERERLKQAVDALRLQAARAADALAASGKEGKERAKALESLGRLLGTKGSPVELPQVGRSLTSPEGEALLTQAAERLAGDEKGQKAVAEVRELIKQREPAPHTSPSSETFSLLVVPYHELTARIGEEEEAKQRDLLKMMKPLRDARDRMSDASLSLSVASANEQTLNAVLARCDAVDDTLKTSHADAIAVRNAYDRIVREQRLNQIEGLAPAKTFEEVAFPLGKVADRSFDRAIDGVKALRRAVDNKDAPMGARAKDAAPKAREAQERLEKLVRELDDVISKMKGLTELRELILLLEDVYVQEGKLLDIANMLRRLLLKRLLEGKD